jgi:hypothetical protein
MEELVAELGSTFGSGRKTRSPADGRNAGHGLRRRTTRGRVRPIFSAPSARPKEKAPGSSCPLATVKPWRFIWRKSRLRSRPARTLSFFLIRRDGMSRRGFPSQTTSRSCRCRRNRPSSIRSRTSGNSCATFGSRTASSNPTTTSSTIAASPGISSSTCPGKSCPSGPETGSTGHDHQRLGNRASKACLNFAAACASLITIRSSSCLRPEAEKIAAPVPQHLAVNLTALKVHDYLAARQEAPVHSLFRTRVPRPG